MDNIRHMLDIFSGNDCVFGIYELEKASYRGDKLVGEAYPKWGHVNKDLWESHLSGRINLAIIPIDNDNKTKFGCIDIDEYSNQDDARKKIFNLIQREYMPLVPVRTKSGGFHLYCFVKEKIECSLMRERLQTMASFLGYSKAEIFPKQSEVHADRGDAGNFINMPYSNITEPKYYGIDEEGSPLSLDDFLARVNKVRWSPKELIAYSLEKEEDLIADGPPCLQSLLKNTALIGGRHSLLINIAIYLKKKWPNDWEKRIDDFNNEKYLTEKKDSKEIYKMISSLKDKNADMHYWCSKDPMVKYCNKNKCRSRRYGIDKREGILNLTNMTKFDTKPPIWFLDVEEGGRLELSTEDLQSQTKFQKRCMEQLNTMPPQVKKDEWQVIIQELMKNVIIIEAPLEASHEGMVLVYLKEFCTDKTNAKTMDQVLRGKVFYSAEENLHYFKFHYFIQFLERKRFYALTQTKIASIIKKEGGFKTMRIGNKSERLWYVTGYDTSVTMHDIPDMGGEEF